MTEPTITSGQEWTFDLIEQMYHEVEDIAVNEFGLNCYPNQLETISFEQMLDAYVSAGMPVFYSHWTFGEQFIKEHEAYRRGFMGLAYEIVINSNPCISYLMEENSMVMQTLVTAHAAFGHNHFFKNNYLFKQWTNADAILDYLEFSKHYIDQCKEKYGLDEVEAVLDAAHALRLHGVDKFKRPPELSAKQEQARREEREQQRQRELDLVWSTIPGRDEARKDDQSDDDKFPKEPQENLLYFIEKNAPRMDEWKREILRIVRKIAQYFDPQRKTKMMNEGCATFFHYKIMHRLHEKGIVDNGAMLEFYHSHSSVIAQPPFDHPAFSGINPYALGFAMARDIERICTEPTDEDYEWFGKQGWVGNNEPIETIKWAFENFKDESFVQQFLSPKVIRDFKMFAIHDDERDPMLEVAGIHDSLGYRTVRNRLAKQYDMSYMIPNIQVTDVDRWGDRTMTLTHYMVNGRPLDTESATETLKHVTYLWGYNVLLQSVDSEQNVRSTYDVQDEETLLDIFLDDGN